MEMGQGKVSEWNEAMLKVMRLHEIQSAINLLKIDPLIITEGKFNYKLLAYNVERLYGEGYSKYSKEEREDVDKIQKLVFGSLRFLPPHINEIEYSLKCSSSIPIFNEDNFNRVMALIEMFERIVKDLNDKHGLTTKNKVHHMF